MQIRSPLDYEKATAEVMVSDFAKQADQTRLQELLEAINSWDCATCADSTSGRVGIGDIGKMAVAPPDHIWPVPLCRAVTKPTSGAPVIVLVRAA